MTSSCIRNFILLTHVVYILYFTSLLILCIYRVGQKTGLCLMRVDNFATVGDRKACDMSLIIVVTFTLCLSEN